MIVKNVKRIEILPPEQLDNSGSLKKLAITNQNEISKIVSSLKLIKSDKNKIEECKVPEGICIKFITETEIIYADVTISGHKHIILSRKENSESEHYELNDSFEKVILPYIKRVLY